MNDATEKVYPELDFADLFAEWQKQEELVKAQALEAREALAAVAAAEAQKTNEAQV